MFCGAVARGDSGKAVGLALAALACSEGERLSLGYQGGEIDVGDDHRHGVLRLEIFQGVCEDRRRDDLPGSAAFTKQTAWIKRFECIDEYWCFETLAARVSR